MILRDAVVEDCGNFDHLGFFNGHPNVSTRAYSIFASIEMQPPLPGFDPATFGSAVERHNR